MCIRIGDLEIENRVFLAPMSGVSDEPFRNLAARAGAGLVVTEMVASADLVRQKDDVLRRAKGQACGSPFVIQLAGREAHWMAEAARVSEAMGADIVDINMGCPAKQVTGSLSGSALMRDLDHALSLIEATVAAVSVPVTLKMRLGWDETSLNADELARRAEGAGVKMVTVHGRTRCQFFSGEADWAAIAQVKRAVSVPVIANGDVRCLEDVEEILAKSGADGVMIGRGAYGKPWLPGVLSAQLKRIPAVVPGVIEQRALVLEHYEEMLLHYGREHGVRCARKHLGWYLEQVLECGVRLTEQDIRSWRGRMCRQEDPERVRCDIEEFYRIASDKAAA